MTIYRIKDSLTPSQALEKATPNPIAINNWPDQFPLCPEVSFRAVHNGDNLYLRYDVREKYSRALETVPGNYVYMDSCAEFFIAPASDGFYYNFEWNCIGTLYLACRTGRDDAIMPSVEVLSMVESHPSLGREPFDERIGDNVWSLEVKIPANALWRHGIRSFNGLKARANFYSCGDGHTQPHFLSWKPISTPNPDFHRPEFFSAVDFE